ncbi:MAG: hypothetical protein KJZ73_02520 [Pseudorhodoplanes sp.]|nr:hypothetical protein [Pseudorhodoplanes sp.]
MQLKVKRSQRSGGMMGNKVIFVLDARAEPTNEEAALIKKYGLGKMNVYDSEARKKYQSNAAGSFDAASASATFGASGKSLASAAWSNAKGLTSMAMMALSLNVTVDGLIAGQHIECKDLDELLGAQQAMIEACKNTKGYLEVASTFDGREEVLEF